jgi:hypothetical protein
LRRKKGAKRDKGSSELLGSVISNNEKSVDNYQLELIYAVQGPISRGSRSDFETFP